MYKPIINPYFHDHVGTAITLVSYGKTNRKIMVKRHEFYEAESVPQVARDIVYGNLPALEEHLRQGWKINKLITISEYTESLPLTIALEGNCFESVKWLVEHGANLNDKKEPSDKVANKGMKGYNVTRISVDDKKGAKGGKLKKRRK